MGEILGVETQILAATRFVNKASNVKNKTTKV
jgi:hypothetical protein